MTSVADRHGSVPPCAFRYRITVLRVRALAPRGHPGDGSDGGGVLAPVADPLAGRLGGDRREVAVHVEAEVTRVAEQHVLLKVDWFAFDCQLSLSIRSVSVNCRTSSRGSASSQTEHVLQLMHCQNTAERIFLASSSE